MRRIYTVALAISALSFTATSMASPSFAAQHEKHPEIHRAIRQLERTLDGLKHANHDFGGHRAKAMEHIGAALSELKIALQFDKH